MSHRPYPNPQRALNQLGRHVHTTPIRAAAITAINILQPRITAIQNDAAAALTAASRAVPPLLLRT